MDQVRSDEQAIHSEGYLLCLDCMKRPRGISSPLTAMKASRAADRCDVGICVVLGISIIGLAAGVPTRVLGSQPSKVSQAQRITPILFLIPRGRGGGAGGAVLVRWRAPPPRGSGRRAFQGHARGHGSSQDCRRSRRDHHKTPSVTPAPQPPQRPSAPVLVAPLSLNAEAAGAARFDVSVGGNPDDLPPGTVVRVSGLPSGAALSGGQASADRGWVVPLWALKMILRSGFPLTCRATSI